MLTFYNNCIDFFIKDKESLSSEVYFKNRTLVIVLLWIYIVFSLLLCFQILGYYSEASTPFLFILFTIALIALKITGKEKMVGLFIMFISIIFAIYNIGQTGHIFSYNHKWFVGLMIFIHFVARPFTLPFMIFAVLFQFFSYYSTPLDLHTGIGLKVDYLMDNIAYIVVCYVFLLVLKRFGDIQNITIDEQNEQLISRQEDLMKSNELLQNRSEQLLVSNQELERFAHIASHDLKTPLNNIISFCQLMEKELKGHDNEKVHQYFHYIKEGSNRMDNLIKDVLEYSTLSGKDLKNDVIDINLLIESIRDSIAAYVERKKATINVLNRLPIIKANRSQMYLLFKNLIENGIKYNQSSSPSIEIKSEVKGEQIRLYIKDNGIGIASKYHENIFQMFSRLHNHQEYEGTGLGLALCKKIVDELEGNISIQSEIGEGTLFIISLDKRLFSESEVEAQSELVGVE